MVSLSRLLAAADDASLVGRSYPTPSSRLPSDCPLPSTFHERSVSDALRLSLHTSSTNSTQHTTHVPVIPLSHILRDLGPESTSPANMLTLARALSHFGRPSERAVAASLLFLTSPGTQESISEDSQSLFQIFSLFCAHSDNPRSNTALQQALNSDLNSLDWRPDVFIQAVSAVAAQTNTPLDWRLVIHSFDTEGLATRLSPSAFVEIAKAFISATGSSLSAEYFVDDWQHPSAQLCLLRYSLMSASSVDWTALPPFDGALEDELLNPYSRVPLVEKLVELDAHDLLQDGAKVNSNTLLASLANSKPKANYVLLKTLIVSLLSPAISTFPRSERILRLVWSTTPTLVEASIISLWRNDPTSLRHILGISLRLEILADLLSSSSATDFTIELAIVAYSEDVLNLETWLTELLSTRGMQAVSSITLFLARKVRTGDPPNAAELPLEAVRIMFKCLATAVQKTSGVHVQDSVEGIREVLNVYIQLNPRMADLNTPLEGFDRNALVGMDMGTSSAPTPIPSTEPAPLAMTIADYNSTLDAASTAAAILYPMTSGLNPTPVGFPSEVDKEADAFFQKLYRGEMPPEQAVERLSSLKTSSSERDREIFNCAMHTLFDEYRFFLKYPDRELKITGVLFGSVIQHSLLSGRILSLAIRCVLDALRTVEPAPQPIGRYAKFGLCALEKIRSRLPAWPHFCSHILTISRLEEIAPDLIGEVRRAVQQSALSVPVSDSGISSGVLLSDVENSALPVVSGEDGVPPPANVTDPADTAKDVSSLLASPTLSKTTTPVKASVSSTSLRASPSVVADGNLGLSPLNLTMLLGMSAEEASNVVAPDELTQDKIKFIFNNLSTATMEDKVAEMLTILRPEIQQYFSVYIVVKRASSESNFHHLYITLLDKIDAHMPTLYPLVYDTSFRRVRVLLSSDVKSSTERLVLKSLGSWIGTITLARNKPILRKDLDLKELLMNAYSNGKLNIVIPFVSKVLEACHRSKVFKISNPWVRGVLGVMKEIYLVDDLKLNMKFELQLLSKALEVDVNDIVSSDLLRGRPAPDKEQNPDFNTKKQPNSSPQRASPTASPPPELQQSYLTNAPTRTTVPTFTLTEAQSSTVSQPAVIPSAQTLNSGRLNVAQGLIPSNIPMTGDVATDLSTMLANADLSSTVPSANLQRSNVHVHESMGLPSTTADQRVSAQNPFNQSEQLLIPTLAQYIQVSPSLVLFQTSPHLKRLIPIAIDRAIREIIQPVVERSCAIAFLTTKELTLKDFADEPDVNKIRRAALQMVQQLAGSLALVTSKEPLRVSMGNQLRMLLTPSASTVNADQNLVEQTAQMVSTANLEIGCAIIERHAKDRAARDLSEKIGPAFANRRSQHSAYTYTAVPGPEVHRIYDEFSRLHRANVPPPQHELTQQAEHPVHQVHAGQAPNATSVSQAHLQSQISGRQIQTFPEHRVSGSSSTLNPDARAPGPPTLSHHHLLSNLGSIPNDAEKVEHVNHGVIGSRRRGLAPRDNSGADTAVISTVYGTPLGPMASPTSVAAAILAAAGSSNASGINSSNGVSSAISSSNLTPGEDPLSTQQVLERFNSIYPRLTFLIQDVTTSSETDLTLTEVPSDHELHSLWTQIPTAVKRSVTADEAGMAVAQKIFKRLYEGETNLYREIHVLILDGIRECCRRLSKELSSWLAFSEDRKKLHRDCIVALMRPPGLLNITAYDEILAKAMDNGRNLNALDFACFLIRKAIIDEFIATAAELYLTLEIVAKIGRRQNPPHVASCPEGLMALVDTARTVVPKPSAAPSSSPASFSNGGTVFGINKSVKESEPFDPAGTREFVAGLLLEWHRIVSCDTSARPLAEHVVMSFLGQVRSGMLGTEDSRERFLRITVELVCAATKSALQSKGTSPVASDLVQAPYTIVEATVRLIGSLCRTEGQFTNGGSDIHETRDVSILCQFLIVLVKDILKGGIHTDFRPHFRMFSGLICELYIGTKVSDLDVTDVSNLSGTYFNNVFADRLALLKSRADCLQFLDDGGNNGFMAFVRSAASANVGRENAINFSNVQVVYAVVGALTACSPTAASGFVFSWLHLISSKELLPVLLSLKITHGWPLFRHLLGRMLEFLGIYLKNPAETLSKGIVTLYNGTLRVLLVLLHDFPEFLCGYHLTLCEVIPENCIQMRNLVLSSFPKDMRPPDPFNPELNTEELIEMSRIPMVLSDYTRHIDKFGVRGILDKVLHQGFEDGFDVKSIVKVKVSESGDARYSPALTSAIVVYAGEFGIDRGGSLNGTWVELIRRLVRDLEPEGRHYVLLGIANQLRFPNKHTMLFSKLILSLFLEFSDEAVKEHMTRVLVERLIANRPHPWGLVVTFVQLIKKGEYNFWGHGFVRCAPEIEQLFENVAKFCVGPVAFNKPALVLSATG